MHTHRNLCKKFQLSGLIINLFFGTFHINRTIIYERTVLILNYLFVGLFDFEHSSGIAGILAGIQAGAVAGVSAVALPYAQNYGKTALEYFCGLLVKYKHKIANNLTVSGLKKFCYFNKNSTGRPKICDLMGTTNSVFILFS